MTVGRKEYNKQAVEKSLFVTRQKARFEIIKFNNTH